MSIQERQEQEAEAMENCENEEIQFVGEIQPYGWLMGVRVGTQVATLVSDNVETMTGLSVGDVLGMPLDKFFSSDLLHTIRNASGHSTITQQREHIGTATVGLGQFDVTMHVADNVAIFELIPVVAGNDAVVSFSKAQAMLNRLSTIDDLNELLDEAVAELRWFSGFDRVKTYRFLSDGSGEIVAEAVRFGVDSFLGLRFPAADIPQSARKLYASTPIRSISDVSGVQAKLVSAAGQPDVDLSLAILRGHVPVHSLYLKNMGVAATLSLPIVIDSEMWGLFAFHHHEPRNLSSAESLVSELLGRSLSILIQAATERRRRRYLDQCLQISTSLFGPNDSPVGFGAYWDSASSELRELIACDGVAFVLKDKVMPYGDCPTEEGMRALVNHAQGVGDDIQGFECLGEVVPSDLRQSSAGALVLADPVPLSDALIFFRNETSDDVRWAGNPEKDLVDDGGSLRLNPRSSFAEYLDNTAGRSSSWDGDEVDLATSLVQALRRSYSTAEMQKEHTDRMGLMVRELNHRVRNILAVVQSLVSQSDVSDEAVAAYVDGLERRIHALAGAHDLLTESEWGKVDLRSLFEGTLRPYSETKANAIVLTGSQVSVDAPVASALTLVIHELASNAAKYGALSNETGQVNLSWQVDDTGFVIDWKESGGPTVIPPTRTGFGTSVITESLAFEFDAEVMHNLSPDGVIARFVLSSQLAIPTEEGDDVSAEGGPGDASGSSDKRTIQILVVEDDFVVSKDTVAKLKRLVSAEVSVVPSVEAALRILDEQTFDFAMLDVNLRGDFSGPVADALTQCGTPFVFATGYGSRDRELVGYESLGILTKPLTKTRLQNALMEAGILSEADV